MALKLSSPAFTHGGQIPTAYTCDGKDHSPLLTWSGVLEEREASRSLSMILTRPIRRRRK